MPDPILIPIETMDIRLSGVPLIEGLPSTGTFMTIEKVSGRTTMSEGLNGVIVFTAMTGTGYNVTVNAYPGSVADIAMSTAAALMGSTGVATFSYIHGLTTYTSPAVRLLTDPTVDRAADGAPLRVHVFGGGFPVTVVGGFGAPPVITEDQILAAIPTT